MRYSSIILLATSLTVFATESPAPSDPFAVSMSLEDGIKRAAANENKKQVFAMRVTLEQKGKEVTSFTAFGSINDRSDKIHCTGVASFDQLNWRISMQADMQDIQYFHTISVDVEDLNHREKNSKGEVVPIEIFSVEQHSRGMGKYIMGEIQGNTLKIEISKAEQDAPVQPPPVPAQK